MEASAVGGRSSAPALGTALLCGLFFVSGAAALVFENVWFRQAGLLLGNSVWATSVVLASFMAGLALGNWQAARMPPGRSVRIYAVLEAITGLAGVAVTLAMTRLPERLTPLLRSVAEEPWALNALRLLTAFVLLCVPTAAMGMTLPVLTRALVAQRVAFGPALGLLYGWNTLGAFAGTLAAEPWLILWLGIRGTGILAGTLNLLAATGAWRFSIRIEGVSEPCPPEIRHLPSSPRSRRLLATGFLTGAALLAAEVVWFRLLLQFSSGTATTFAAMLSVVLLGIGGGGLAASAWLRRSPSTRQHLRAILCLIGMALVATYAGLRDVVIQPGGTYAHEMSAVWLMAAILMGLPSLLSGVAFTLLGASIQAEIGGSSRAAGLLTVANTTGALVGSLIGGFVLLPGLGTEKAVFALALTYGIGALLVPAPVRGAARAVRIAARVGAGAYVVFVALFPFGLGKAYLKASALTYVTAEDRIVAIKEGLTETIIYVEERDGGEVVSYRLLTNGFSMSSTAFGARRYMKLFVYLPVALHPAPRRALLISFGVGSTAKALTDTRELEGIDVVDISKDVLEASRIAYPDQSAHPLNDRRVRVHIEDGRYFLQASQDRFDLITAEPPPPKSAGVVNLYTEDYFHILRDRLADGGFVTYWLPVHSLALEDTRAILKAFCSAFPDCSLWNGMDLDWVMLGSRNARERVSEERFRRQWDDPVVGPEMRALGIEAPEQMSALFLADAPELARIVDGALPLTDDRPYRLSPFDRQGALSPLYPELMDATRAVRSFARSPWVGATWPPQLARASLSSFGPQQLLYDGYWGNFIPARRSSLADLHALLNLTRLRTLPLLMMHGDPDLVRIAEAKVAAGDDTAWVHAHMTKQAFSLRDYAGAARHGRAAYEREPQRGEMAFLTAYALALGGEHGQAQAFLTSLPSGVIVEADRLFLTRTFGLVVGSPSDRAPAP